MVVTVNPASVVPHSREGYYAINNQFLESGPKGFCDLKILENDDLFVRIDLPGILKQCLKVSLDPSTKKSLLIEAFAPSLNINDSSPRTYFIATGIVCNCCEISGFTSDLSNGVLRLLISRTQIFLEATCPFRFPRSLKPNDSALTGFQLQLHPSVIQGPNLAYEFALLVTGGLYVRVDMPGVPKDSFNVSVTNGRVRVTGHAPAVSHDSADRFYSGDVAVLSAPIDIPISHINIIAKYGVIRLLIYPPPS